MFCPLRQKRRPPHIKMLIRKLLSGFKRASDEPRFKVTGRDTYQFSERGRKLTVFVEHEGRERGIAILRDSMRTWDSPIEGESVSEDDKSRIAELLHQYLSGCGIKNYID